MRSTSRWVDFWVAHPGLGAVIVASEMEVESSAFVGVELAPAALA